MEKLLKDIASAITPSKYELLAENRLAHSLVKIIGRAAGNKGKAVLVGSIAKGTFLKDRKDMDIFVLFPKTVKKEEFEGIVRKIVKRAFPSEKFELKYAEHPYARVYSGGRRIDVVPAYKIKYASERGSAVDRSVLHTKFVLLKLKKGRIKDVLLLKKFLLSNELYGAEIKVQGFSGYLCELLIMKYGGLVELLRNAAKWKSKAPVFIDLKKYYEKKFERDEAIKKFNTPLVVIDPTDRDRNVSAALSEENFKKFVSLAKRFLRSPDKRFFSDPLTFEEKIKRMNSVYLLSIPKPDAVDDIIWGQLRKLSHQLLQFLEANEFEVVKCLMDVDKEIKIAISVKKDRLTENKILLGPSTKLDKNVEEFKKAHKGGRFFVKKGRIATTARRELVTLEQAIKRFLSTAMLPSHFANIKNRWRVNRIYR